MTPDIAVDVVRFHKASVAEKECQEARMIAAAAEMGKRWIWSRLGFFMVLWFGIFDRDYGSSTGDMVCGFAEFGFESKADEGVVGWKKFAGLAP